MPAARLNVALLLVATSLAGVRFAHAQIGRTAGIASGAPDQPKVTVQGVVLDRLSQQPIARALVDGAYDAVLTDNEGRFQLMLPEGRVNLQVRRPGYNARNGGMHSIQVSATPPLLTLYLTPSGSIIGQVSLAGDDDPTGIRFEAYRKNVSNGHESWVPAGVTLPDSDGTFRFLQLDAPGSFIVCSAPSSEMGPQRGAVTGFPQKCFPGDTDFASVTPLELAAGQQAQLDVKLEMQPFYPVTISVPNPENSPGIQIHDRTGFAVPAARFVGQVPGRVEFRLPNGNYYADARIWGPKQLYGRVDFTVANAPLVLSLPLAPLQPVPVVIQKEFTADAQRLPQIVDRRSGEREEDPGLNLILAPAGKAPTRDFGGGGLRQVSGDGVEMDAAPGRWRAQVYAYQGYVSSMTSGGVDLLRDPLVIGSDSSVQPIYITLRNDGGQIQCSVSGQDSGDDPASASPVYYAVAIAQFPAAMPIVTAVGQNGRPVTIGNLPPGGYRVAAFDSMPTIDLDDADQLSRVMAGAQSVHVDANGKAAVQLSLTPLANTGANP